MGMILPVAIILTTIGLCLSVKLGLIGIVKKVKKGKKKIRRRKRSTKNK